jgi:hypothetical protein
VICAAEIPISAAEIKTCRTEITISQTEIATSQTEIATSQTEIAISRTEITISRTEIATSRTEITISRTEITISEAQIAIYRTGIASHRSEITCSYRASIVVHQIVFAHSVFFPRGMCPSESAGKAELRPRKKRRREMSAKTRSEDRSSTSRITVRKRSTATAAAAGDPVGAASRMIQLLDELEAIIPDLTQPDISRIGRVAQSAKFAHQLILPTINAVTSYPPLQKRNLFDVAAGQAALDFRDQLHPISMRMAAITVALSYTINQKLAASGDEALQTYQWAKRHVKQPDGGGARTYVDEMQRFVERAMNRRRKAQIPVDAPPPTTPTQGFLAPSLSTPHPAPDDNEMLDLVHEIAEPNARK